MIGGIVGLAALYLVSLFPLTENIIPRLEHHVFRALNGLLGHNAALDWTFLIAASSFWIYLSLIVVGVIALIEAWQARHRDYGERFGFMGLVVLLAFAVEEAADFVADHVQRDLPWDDGALARIQELYDVDFLDIPSKEGLLDENLCYWVFFLLLLNGRFPRTVLTGAALISLHLLAQLSVGAQWLGDGLASSFSAMILGGAMLRYGDRTISWWERKGSENFLEVFWRSFRHLPPALMHSRQPRFHQRVALIGERIRNRKRFMWNRLMRERVLPLLNADPDQARWTSEPPAQFLAGFRPSPQVRFLTLPGGELFVVRSIERWGGFFGKSRRFRRYRDAAHANLFLNRLGLPAPRAYWVQEGFTHGGFANQAFMIEQFIAGRPLDLDSPAEVRAACRVLADLHRHHREQWGPVAAGVHRSGGEYLYQWLRKQYLYQLRRAARWLKVKFDSEDVASVWRSLEAETVKALNRPEPFALVHGDVHFRNFLIDGNNEVHLIDFVTVGFDLPGWEPLKAALSLSRRNPIRAREVWLDYWSMAGPEAWERFLAEATLALARVAIYELSNRRALRVRALHGIPAREVIEWLKELFERAPEFIGARPEETQWERLIEFLEARRVENVEILLREPA